MKPFSRPLLPALILLALPAGPAAAVETEGRGENVTHVKNIQFPDLREPFNGVSTGTDMEFATITVGGQSPGPDKPAKPKNPRAEGKGKPSTSQERTFAFVGSYADGLQVIDITDPDNATLVATWDCGVTQGDVQVFQREDLGGRWFVTYTHDTGYTFRGGQCHDDLVAMGRKGEEDPPFGTYIAEVTDPYNPKTVSFWPVQQGSHNQTVHPSGRYLYNSNSDLIVSFLPAVEIADITDIENPTQVGEIELLTVPGLGTESHDITFNEEGDRAYVAALSHGEVLDTTDPANPSRAGVILDPAINVWHQSDPVTIDDPVLGERDFIIVEDEVAGALPTGQCPNGGVHVYDATGDRESAPVKVGYWNIDDAGLTENGLGTCTAHVFELHPEEKLMTIAYYNGGVRVVDISGLVGVALGENGVGMKQLGFYRFPDSDTWSVKTPAASREGFHMYGGDMARGFDVYRYEPGESTASGAWMSPAEHEQLLKEAVASGVKFELGGVCLLGEENGRTVERAAEELTAASGTSR